MVSFPPFPLVRIRPVSYTHLDVYKRQTLDYSELDSFVILIGLKGEAKITDNEGNEITLQGCLLYTSSLGAVFLEKVKGG